MKATLMNVEVRCEECGKPLTQRQLEEGPALTCTTPDCKNNDADKPKYFAMPSVTLSTMKESKKDERARQLVAQGENPEETFAREEQEQADAKAAADREKELKAAQKGGDERSRSTKEDSK